MAPHSNLLAKKLDNKNKSTNIVDLLKETKLREKEEKRSNIYIAAAAVSVLALSGFIISN